MVEITAAIHDRVQGLKGGCKVYWNPVTSRVGRCFIAPPIVHERQPHPTLLDLHCVCGHTVCLQTPTPLSRSSVIVDKANYYVLRPLHLPVITDNRPGAPDPAHCPLLLAPLGLRSPAPLGSWQRRREMKN